MGSLIEHFFSDDSGAVTVDWVVISAIFVLLALIVMSVFSEVADGRIEVINDGIDANL